jgi:predicted nucleotidyltransferase
VDILKNTGEINPNAAKKIIPYIKDLLRVHAESIISVFIYGSAAGGDYLKGLSDINSVIVFKDIGARELKKSLSIVDRGIRRGIDTPLFLTRQHIMTSLDTFPVEFIEIKENYIVIYGEDVLSAVDINRLNIRFVCEERIKGALIRIRQGYLEIGLRKKGVEALIKESFASLFPAFRGMLRLKGISPFRTKKEDIEAMGKAFGIDTGILLAILADRHNNEKINSRNLDDMFFKYIEQVERLGDIADKLI